MINLKCYSTENTVAVNLLNDRNVSDVGSTDSND